MDERRTIVFFKPSKEVCDRYFEVFKLLSDKFHNEYMAHAKDYSWDPHVMVYLSSIPLSNTHDVIKKVGEIAREFSPFEILFTYYKALSGSYISSQATDPAGNLKRLNSRLIDALSPFRTQKIEGKYQEKWDSFTDEEKERTQKYGIPYEYSSHLTIAKLRPEECEPALELLKSQQAGLRGLSFTANTLLIAQDNLDPHANWPVIGHFEL